MWLLKLLGIRHKDIYGCEARGDADSVYMSRWYLYEGKRFELHLNYFRRSDFDVMHDHPFDFYTFPLWRGYWDETLWGIKRVWPGWIYFRPSTHRHRVRLIKEKPALTLVLAKLQSNSREWGFWPKQGWVSWKDYFRSEGCT